MIVEEAALPHGTTRHETRNTKPIVLLVELNMIMPNVVQGRFNSGASLLATADGDEDMPLRENASREGGLLDLICSA
jgi:hypothetical protein